MTNTQIEETLQTVQKLDPALRYWIFKNYIKTYNDLDFLKAEIEYEIKKRERK